MATTRSNEFGQTIGADLSQWTHCVKPAPVVLRGKYVTLEPMDPERHTPELWEAYAEGNASDWTYLFADCPETQEAMLALYKATVAKEELVPYVIMSRKTGKAVGTVTFMNISLVNGDVEIGSINFARQLRRSRQATESIYLMMSRVMDDLGYRRLVWKCDALNGASRSAALRYGFTMEGIFRNHMVVKNRTRDTAWFSIVNYDWKARKDAFEAWLSPDNFDEEEKQKMPLSAFMPTSLPTFH